ncbi:MAG: SufE family protein [Candidatus Marinimicrobia bacterium]|nr:SufE family protein [Candidatus Neomarinimicrobiota bacterium]MDD5583272.1 SufE family protein [Candidatus Neomarinimicrobiota bacterium]
MAELHEISPDDLTAYFSMLPGWEEKFTYILDLGKKLLPYPDEFRDDKHRIYGCQSMVWLKIEMKDGKLYFVADADAALVRGLIAILMIAYNGKSPQEILTFDIDQWFESLGLRSHLSPTRSNGLNAMVKSLQAYARNALNQG